MPGHEPKPDECDCCGRETSNLTEVDCLITQMLAQVAWLLLDAIERRPT